MSKFEPARKLLQQFKGNTYLFGNAVLDRVGDIARQAGQKAALVSSGFPQADTYAATIKQSLQASGVTLAMEIAGARPNAPREDLQRIAGQLCDADPDLIISFGGGSTIDAAKAGEVLRTLGGEIDSYFGVGLVTKALHETHKTLTPHIAIQTAASSAAHLTKYANITDISTGQKKLVVDEAIVPAYPVFDYEVTYAVPRALTLDGALDGIAHILEVLYGAMGKDYYPLLAEIAQAGISLVLAYLPRALDDPNDQQAREALCLATDLGGYAIMVGGTNGGHLTSFSLVDVLSHGRACAIMNPYYTVFFAPAIVPSLQLIAGIYQKAGYIDGPLDNLSPRALAEKVAQGMFAFAKRIGFPTKLAQVPGFNSKHVDRALQAAKNPQLKMKLENMPVPLTADMIDEYMQPVLQAAIDEDLSLIRNVS